MKIIESTTLTADKVVSSNVPEADAPEWNADTTYALGALVMREHAIWESITEPNLNQIPEDSPDFWQRNFATNRFQMFDGIIGDSTSNPNKIEVRVRPGGIATGLGFFGLRGKTLLVEVRVSGAIVYTRTVNLQNSVFISNWYAYFFEPLSQLQDVILDDLPTYNDPEIRVVIDAEGAAAECGEMVVGRLAILGAANFGTAVSIQDYSRKERDQFGQIIVVPRRFAKLADFDVTVETNRISEIQQLLARIRTTPTIFIGDIKRPETIVYGFYRSFRIVIDNPVASPCSIEVEGLV